MGRVYGSSLKAKSRENRREMSDPTFIVIATFTADTCMSGSRIVCSSLRQHRIMRLGLLGDSDRDETVHLPS